MAKTLSNLLLDTTSLMGLTLEPFLATGGSTTTIVNSLYDSLESPPTTDFALNYTAFIQYDAAGAGAAPQGEYQRISAYDESTWTFTTATFTAAPASGDRVVILTNRIPFQQLILLANEAISDYGKGEVRDTTSLTTVANQTEYSLPAGVTKENLKNVLIQGITTDSNDNRWRPISFEVRTNSATAVRTLVIDQFPADYDLMLVYFDYHPALTIFSSAISDSVPYALLKSAFRMKIVDWFNNFNEGESEFWLSHDRKAAGLFDIAKLEHPYRPPPIRNKLTNLGKNDIDDFKPIPLL